MSVPKKDVDPATELVEEDDEQSLPEVETAVDLAAGAGPLAAGRAAILRHVKLAPSAPGVYRMVDAHGAVLYVGKAKNIRKRIASYARPTGYDPRIERMIAATAALEFVSTRTETEALLLEANLIKRLRPRFNVLLRDDKSFPYILITGDHWAPQILKHRGARNRDGRYYGPFASVWAVNRTITALQRAFLLRSCSDGFFESRTRPCLLHQIKRCSAPCTREIDFADYQELVREATAFLSGKSRAVKEELAAEMEKASEALDFERAAVYRDRLAALSAVQAQQGINPRSTEEADVFAVHQEGGFFCVEVFFFRTGQNWGNRAYFPKADRTFGPGEVLGAFLAQFYDDKPVPELILVSHEIEDCALLEQALSTKSGRKVEIALPKRGEKKELVDHALANAREALGRKLADTASQRKLLDALAECFGLARAPRRIEVYDNSHIQGTQRGRRHGRRRAGGISEEPVPQVQHPLRRPHARRRLRDDARGAGAALQAAAEGIAASCPPIWRRAAVAGSDGTFGVAASSVTLSPLAGRGSHCAKRDASGEGGSREIAVAEKRPLTPTLSPQAGRGRSKRRERRTSTATKSRRRSTRPGPIWSSSTAAAGSSPPRRRRSPRSASPTCRCIAIAKGPERDAGRETFFVPGREPFKLKPRDPVLYFVQRLRDEAHRFAIGSHRARRKKDIRESGLQEIRRRRPRAQARAAAAFRNAESDRARVTRRPGQGRRRQRRDGEEDLRFFP